MTSLYMRNTLIGITSLISVITSIFPASSATVTFAGAKLPIQEVTPEKNTGLDKVYVTYDTQGLSIIYNASTSQVTWYRYGALGGGYAEELTSVSRQGNEYTLPDPEGDMGYIIEDGDNRYYFWLVDYSRHRLYLSGITIPSEQDCSMTHIELQGSGTPIHFYTINGRQCTLDQQIGISYRTLEYSESDRLYNQVSTTYNLESFSNNIYINPAPLCNTTFHASGDRFLRAWNWLQEAESPLFNTNAVDARTYAEQTPESTDPDYKSNQMGSSASDGSLGGSAPAEVSFSAICSDAVIHHEWQFASDPDFEHLTLRLNEQDVDYVFREQGVTYVRYIGSNADGTCETYGDTYTVSIGTSDIKCPNAFSPGASEGVNDEWKVSYRSIIDFKCWIFNRHGRQLFYFTDPSLGWDGKVGGKVVKTGVYYYVIEATGADGKKYKLSGDINVIGYRQGSGSTGDDSGADSDAP